MAKFKNAIGILETNNTALIEMYGENGYEEISDEPAVNAEKPKPKGKKTPESE